MRMGECNVVVERFGPPGLVERLCAKCPRCSRARIGWERCADGGQNFTRLCIGGYSLTRPADKQCSVRYVVTVTDGVTGQRFHVRGFCFPDLPRALQSGPPVYKRSTIVGVPLRKRSKPGWRSYTISVQAVG